MKSKYQSFAVVPCLLGAVLTLACTTSGDPRPASPMPEQTATPRAGTPASEHAHDMHALPASAGPGYTVADVRFMQNMIGHHAQALVMAAMAPTRGAGEQLLKLVQKIDISQRDEIAFMERWLADRGQAVPDSAHAHGMLMPGMLTAEQMARLDAARGAEFERLFLTFMIQHHRGALDMVEALFDSPGAGQDSDIFRFATDVDADQRDEIWVMEGMLGMLGNRTGSR